MTNNIDPAKTHNAFNRKASLNNINDVYGPLQTLVTGNSWVGDTGFNLMVVPSPLGPYGFIVIISQLFETDVFEAVPAPVPNRTLNQGTAQNGAVKYSQKVAENASKNILHEETGMWLNQTLGTNPPTIPPNGLQAIQPNAPLAPSITTFPLIRSGVIPHGNTFQAAGICTSNSFNPSISGNISPYLALENFPTLNGQLNFLPVYTDGSDPTQLQQNYRAAIADALLQIRRPDLTVEEFINPIGFLNAYANNIQGIDSIAVTTADNRGMVLNVPFEKAVAGPQNFVCTFVIETIQNFNAASAPKTDQVATFSQIQYLQSIPLLFPGQGSAPGIIFPHWNVNTLIAI